jgi:hypothetical protein
MYLLSVAVSHEPMIASSMCEVRPKRSIDIERQNMEFTMRKIFANIFLS